MSIFLFSRPQFPSILRVLGLIWALFWRTGAQSQQARHRAGKAHKQSSPYLCPRVEFCIQNDEICFIFNLISWVCTDTFLVFSQALLAKYEGHEEELLSTIKEKYGVSDDQDPSQAPPPPVLRAEGAEDGVTTERITLTIAYWAER